MNTVLVTTAHLDDSERARKTVLFVDYYLDHTPYDIVVFDNASSSASIHSFMKTLESLSPDSYTRVKVQSFPIFHGRPSLLDYPYLWRAVYNLQSLLVSYDKVIYMDNDFYVLSEEMFEFLDRDATGQWKTFYSDMFSFPETGCHILGRDCVSYHNFVKSGNYMEHNNTIMEQTLPVTSITRSFKGDRYSEQSPIPQLTPDMDYWAQATIEDAIRITDAYDKEELCQEAC